MRSALISICLLLLPSCLCQLRLGRGRPDFDAAFRRVHGPLEDGRGARQEEDVGEPLYLTPFINNGSVDEARELSRVGPLYGLTPEEQPESFSGFITVGDPETDSNMFFWFIPAIDVDSSTAPLSTWLQGGPGASSLYGMLELNGPFLINYGDKDDPTFRAEINPNGWAKVANMLYIDNPVGAGYSYATLDGLPRTQEEVGDNLYEFLIQWFQLFPEYQTNDFFAFGESYAGKYIPTLATKILAENPTASIQINLAGLGIGDGVMSPEDQFVYGDFLYELGYADALLRDDIKVYEERLRTSALNGDYVDAYLAWDQVLEFFEVETDCDNYYDHTLCYFPIEQGNYKDFLALDSTKLAIHVGDLPFGSQSDACYDLLIPDIAQSKRSEIEALLETVPILMYNGNFDVICNHAGILNMFHAMTQWSGVDEYATSRNAIYEVDGKTAGYLRSVGNLRLLVVRNAGHAIPEKKPEVALDLFTKFINGQLN